MKPMVFRNPFFEAQLLRAIGLTYYGGADVSECLATAASIRDGDAESWYTAWTATADRLYRTAFDARGGPCHGRHTVA